MAVYGNFKGTTQPSFKVGKSGKSLYGEPTQPASPSQGDIWLDSANSAIRVYDGSDWDNGQFIGNLEGFMEFEAQAGENISKGDVVYVSGSSGNLPIVSKALANSATTMPAFGIANQTINQGNTGYIVTQGLLTGIDTSSFSQGETLYVDVAITGKFTNVAPAGESNKIQNIGKVVNSAVGGSIMVGGAGRFNATNALDQGNIFIGNASGVTVSTPLSNEIANYLDLNTNYLTSDLDSGNIYLGNANGVAESTNLSQALINGGFLLNIVEDTTPQLGGNLDVNGQTITSFGSDNIVITPTGTGYVQLDGLNWPQADGTANQYLQTDGSGTLSFADGPIGYTGSQGSQGTTGFTGSIGFTGSKGDTGFTGSRGDTGFSGSQGFTGSKGDTGFTGSQGLQGGTGFTGSQGDQGVIGYTGSQGVGFTGSQGTQGVIGFTGSKGDKGFTGSKGDQGVIGFTGSVSTTPGPIGFTGSKGDTGFTGSVGFTGSKGDIGFTGSKGDKGDVGFTGSKGESTAAGSYVHTQGSAATTWTVTHNLGVQYVNVEVIDSSGNSLVGTYDYPTLSFDSTSQLTATFTSATAGYLAISAGQGFTGSAGAGFTGSQGATGFNGSRGDTGFTGSKGDQGDTGFTGSIGFGGSVGFTGSKGDQGTKGFTGSQGATGFTGSQGLQGGTGFTGSQGATGFNGSRGFTGSKGDIGFTGSTGLQGITGFDGSTGAIGFTGSKGDQGVIGFTGSKGDQGTAGFTGSAGAQGLIGFTGSKGDQGNVGFTGSKGDQGVIGFTGSQGTQGTTGFNGSRGDTGFTGSAGSQGLIGFTGSKGDQGNVGFTGSQGNQGVIGFTGSKGDIGFTGSKGDTGFNGSIGFTGSQGGFGGATFEYEWSTDTAVSDPGAGNVKINNANLTSGTILSIDDTDATGTDIQQFLRTIDDSSSAIKGHFRMANKLNADDFVMYTISAISEETGYFQVTVSYVDGSATSFTNGEELIMTFARTGDKGDTGFTGSKGDTGFTGSKGDTGFTGSAGTAGTTGFTGSQGAQGLIGFTGSKGDQGNVGFTGSQGTQGTVGFTGSKGNIGFTGSQGTQGTTGFTGSQGAQGLIGFTGSKGDQGVVGFTGSAGTNGTTGFTGSKGDTGFTGSQGESAIAGAFTHTQSSASATWTITHNLDSQYLNVEVIDSTGNSMVGTANYPVVNFTSANVTTLTFSTSVAGYAAITSGGGVAGSQGATGFTGSQGTQGPIGFTGSKGDTGFTGSKGDTGFTGSIGFSGSAGPQSISSDANNLLSFGSDSLIMGHPANIDVRLMDFSVLPDSSNVTMGNVYIDENDFIKYKPVSVRPKHVFIMAGQSNMIGRATFDNGATHPSNVYQYNQSGQVVAASNPLDHRDPTNGDMGLDITFSIQYMNENPDVDLIFIPVAEGGTGFATNDWNVGDTVYEAMVTRTNAAFAANTDWQLKGFLWHQGEADKSATDRANYSTAWNAMINNFISRTVMTSDTPVVLGGLFNNGADAVAMSTVIEGVADARDYTTFVDASALTSFDNLHFDAASLRTIGTQYYINWKAARTADQRAEFGAAGHWIFGSNTGGSLTDIISGLTVTSSQSIGINTNYVQTANVALSGLDSQIAGNTEQTVCVVVRQIGPAGTNTIRFGNLRTSSEGNGRSVFLGGTSERFNDRSGIGFVDMQNVLDTTNTWMFEAFSYTQTGVTAGGADVLCYTNPSTGIETYTGSGTRQNPTHNIGFGNLWYNDSNFARGSGFAEAIIFNRALTKAELDQVFTRSVARMAARGITLSTGTTGTFDV